MNRTSLRRWRDQFEWCCVIAVMLGMFVVIAVWIGWDKLRGKI
jgi:hypothetical protein